MGLSETILAAMIGAIATVTTALFQLFMAFRARGKVDARPKRGTTLRSILAILALMVASAAGGFLYSEFLKQRSGEEMRAMRQELKELTAFIAQSKDGARTAAAVVEPESQPAHSDMQPVTALGGIEQVESIVYIPACRPDEAAAACSEGDAQRIALCGTIPAYARVQRIELFAQPDAVQHPWDRHPAAFEQDLGGARFTGNSFEYAQADDLKAVCVNFMHWSSEHPHIARVLVHYGFGDAPPSMPPGAPDLIPTTTSAVIAADSLPVVANPASFPTPAAVQ